MSESRESIIASTGPSQPASGETGAPVGPSRALHARVISMGTQTKALMSFLVLALLAVATRGASAQHPNRHGSKVPAKAIPLPVKFPVVDSDGQIKQIDLELDLPALAAAAGAGGAAQRSDRGGPRRGCEAVARGESGASYASVYVSGTQDGLRQRGIAGCSPRFDADADPGRGRNPASPAGSLPGHAPRSTPAAAPRSWSAPTAPRPSPPRSGTCCRAPRRRAAPSSCAPPTTSSGPRRPSRARRGRAAPTAPPL